jgi:GNAT superfamily N-acetyltransferase
MKPEVKINSVSDLPSEQRKELEKWFQEEFGNRPYKWTPPNWYVTAWIENTLIGRAGIIERDVLVGKRTLRVGGISGIITRPKWRRLGVASAIIDKAVAFIKDELGAQFGLLLSKGEVAPLYTRLGWKPVEGPTTFEQPSGPTTYPKLTMVIPCSNDEWPAGEIDLCGLPW